MMNKIVKIILGFITIFICLASGIYIYYHDMRVQVDLKYIKMEKHSLQIEIATIDVKRIPMKFQRYPPVFG